MTQYAPWNLRRHYTFKKIEIKKKTKNQGSWKSSPRLKSNFKTFARMVEW